MEGSKWWHLEELNVPRRPVIEQYKSKHGIPCIVYSWSLASGNRLPQDDTHLKFEVKPFLWLEFRCCFLPIGAGSRENSQRTSDGRSRDDKTRGSAVIDRRHREPIGADRIGAEDRCALNPDLLATTWDRLCPPYVLCMFMGTIEIRKVVGMHGEMHLHIDKPVECWVLHIRGNVDLREILD